MGCSAALRFTTAWGSAFNAPTLISSSSPDSESPASNPNARNASRSVLAERSSRCNGHSVAITAIDNIAGHCDSYSASCSKTIRTARSGTSGKYFFDSFIAPSPQSSKSPEILGRFTRHWPTRSSTASCTTPTRSHSRASPCANGRRPLHYPDCPAGITGMCNQPYQPRFRRAVSARLTVSNSSYHEIALCPESKEGYGDSLPKRH